MVICLYLSADGPRGSLRRLRNQLAEDGCVESQVQLAKQLLEERCGNIIPKILNKLCNFNIKFEVKKP